MAPDDGTGAPTVESLQARIAALEAEKAAAAQEAAGHRLNADKARTAAETAAARAADAEKTAGEKVAAAEAEKAEAVKKASERAVNADLRAALKDAGAADVADMLALFPRDKLKFDRDGDVTNAAEVVAELKAAKPWAFGQTSTSSTATPPVKTVAGGRKATEMTHEEWQAARKELLKR